MNGWTFDGVKETYERTGISFDKYYFESETYLKGKDEIMKGLEKGVFFKAEDGSVRIDVTDVVGKGKDEDNHEKVLLRKDGTSVYITQDIGTAISRHDDWAFNQLVYVVASEQNYHFKILFHILKKLGFVAGYFHKRCCAKCCLWYEKSNKTRLFVSHLLKSTHK
jgi:arginyl-tRNA synthetase